MFLIQIDYILKEIIKFISLMESCFSRWCQDFPQEIEQKGEIMLQDDKEGGKGRRARKRTSKWLLVNQSARDQIQSKRRFIPNEETLIKTNENSKQSKNIQINRQPIINVESPSQEFINLISQKKIRGWVFVFAKIHDAQYDEFRQDITELLPNENNLFQSIEQLQDFLNKHSKQSKGYRMGIGETLFNAYIKRMNEGGSIFKEKIQKIHLVSDRDFVVTRKALQMNNVVIHLHFQQITQIFRSQAKLVTFSQYKTESNNEDQISQLRFTVLFPNFISIKRHQKTFLRQYRTNILGLLSLSKQDLKLSNNKFIQYSEKVFGMKYRKQIEQYKEKTMGHDELSFSKQYNEWFMTEYTKDSYFYRIINNTLRAGGKTQNFFAIGSPFNRIFNCIKKSYSTYERNIEKTYKKKQLIVYRRAILTADEATYLRSNLGGYIETLGFISTSKDRSVAYNWQLQIQNKQLKKKPGQILEFILNPIKFKDRNNQLLENGFIDLHLRKLSERKSEQEVLLNAMNIFKVIQHKEATEQVPEIFRLEYGSVYQTLLKDPTQLTQQERQIQDHIINMEEIALNIQCVGDCFLQTNQFQKAKQYYKDRKQEAQTQKEILKLDLKIAQAHSKSYDNDEAQKIYKNILQKYELQPQIKMEVKEKLAANYTQNQDFQQIEKFVKNAKQNVKQPIQDYDFRIKQLFHQASLLQLQKQTKTNLSLIDEQIRISNQLQAVYKQIQSLGQYLQSDQKKLLLFKQLELYADMTLLETTKNQQSNKQNITLSTKRFFEKKEELEEFVTLQNYEKSVIQRRIVQIQFEQFKYRSCIGDKNGQSHKDIANLQTRTKRIINQVVAEVGELSEPAQLIRNLHLYSGISRLQTIPTDESYMEAKKANEKALTIALKTSISQSSAKVIQCQNELAICERQYRNYDRAIQILNNSSKTTIKKKGENHSSIGKTYFNLGLLYFDKGELQMALSYYEKALKIFQNILKQNYEKSSIRNKIQLEIATIFLDRQDNRLENRLKGLIAVSNNQKDQPHRLLEVGKTKTIIGLKYMQEGKDNQAINNFQQAIQAIENHSGKKCRILADVLCNLALCKERQIHQKQLKGNESMEVDKILNRAQDIYRYNVGSTDDYNIHPLKASFEWYLGLILKMRRKYEEAANCFKKVGEINKRYQKTSRLKQFFSRLDICECLLGLNASQSQISKNIYDLRKDIEEDVVNRGLWDKVSVVQIKNNKVFFVLKRVYQICEDQKRKLIN